MFHQLNNVRNKALIWICRHDDRMISTQKLVEYFNGQHGGPNFKLKTYMHRRIARLTLQKPQKLELIDYFNGTCFKLKWHHHNRRPPWNMPQDYKRQPPTMDQLNERLDDWLKNGGPSAKPTYFDFGNL